MTQSLGELEQLCNVMYNSHNPNERAHAEGVLRPFSSNPEYIPQCKVRRDAWLFFARAHPFNNTPSPSSPGHKPALVSRSSRHAPERRSRPASPASPPGAPGSRRALASRSPAAAKRSARQRPTYEPDRIRIVFSRDARLRSRDASLAFPPEPLPDRHRASPSRFVSIA